MSGMTFGDKFRSDLWNGQIFFGFPSLDFKRYFKILQIVEMNNECD